MDKIKCKYSIGEKVFYVKDSILCEESIKGIITTFNNNNEENIPNYYYIFTIKGYKGDSIYSHEWIGEKLIYKTKEDYISSL